MPWKKVWCQACCQHHKIRIPSPKPAPPFPVELPQGQTRFRVHRGNAPVSPIDESDGYARARIREGTHTCE